TFFLISLAKSNNKTFNMKTKYSLILAVILICCGMKSYSTHLMGGNITYTYGGYNSSTQLYAFTVTIDMYRYCLADSSTATLDLIDSLGVYTEDPLNPNANKIRQSKIGLPLISAQYVVPTSPGCSVGNNVCVQHGIYQGIIHVPASTGGYHLMFDRCCRNAG